MVDTKFSSRRVLLWDFDGTIVDTIPLVFFALRQAFLYCDRRWVSDEEIARMFGPPEDELLSLYMQQTSMVRRAQDMYHDLYGKYHGLFTIYHRRMGRLLETLAHQGYVHAIVTGKGRRSLAISLETLGITGYFSAAITGSDITSWKPHPESLVLALQKLGASPAEAVMIGDSEADYEAALSLGIPAIIAGWYRTPRFDGVYRFMPDLEGMFQLFIHNYRSLPDQYLRLPLPEPWQNK